MTTGGGLVRGLQALQEAAAACTAVRSARHLEPAVVDAALLGPLARHGALSWTASQASFTNCVATTAQQVVERLLADPVFLARALVLAQAGAPLAAHQVGLERQQLIQAAALGALRAEAERST